jgi:lysophospholipase L1-like esterase
MRAFGLRARLAVSGGVVAVAIVVALVLGLGGSGGSAGQGPAWVAVWGASQVVGAAIPGLTCPASVGLSNQTVRDVVFLSAGGDELRVRLSNTFGRRAIKISHGTVARATSGSNGDAVPASIRELTFGGKPQVTLTPGGMAISDPVPLRAVALSDLLISLYVPGPTGPVTGHPFATQANFLATGDRTTASSSGGFTGIQCWMFVSGVDVQGAGRYGGSVVALGDSITDGYLSTLGANHRWPDDLARRLNSLPGPTLSVVNAGLVGNRLLARLGNPELAYRADLPQYGVPASARLNRDVLSQPGVRDVILLEGVNDLAYGATADEIIAADKQIIARVHASGLRIFGATLTPFAGSVFDRPAAEATRAAVNQWIMTSHEFDGVFDFARAVASPGDPRKLNPAFDSGDHSHPNDAGYQAMANAIDLSMLLG